MLKSKGDIVFDITGPLVEIFSPIRLFPAGFQTKSKRLNKDIPTAYHQHLGSRYQSILGKKGLQRLTLRGFWIGCFLSFFLAIAAPYGNMFLNAYMSLDFGTPAAIFFFLLLTGVLNLVFKLAGRNKSTALVFALVTGLVWLYAYWPFKTLDPHSLGLIFSGFLLFTALVNIPVVWTGRTLALNRAELILVYVMLLIVSALCTMGLVEQILPLLTAIFYFASPENEWTDKLFPHFPDRNILVQDDADNKMFYEGMADSQQGIPYGAWIEPLMWWAIFLLALYVSMVSIAVLLRRQWMERERLPYPIAQVGLAMIRGEDSHRLVNGFFRQPVMWCGCALPLFIGSQNALSRFIPSIPVIGLGWTMPFVGTQNLQLNIEFGLLGFSYFISANIAAGICFFHLLSKFQKEFLLLIGLKSEQMINFGPIGYTFLGYQGAGALIAMVLVGLWIGREHFKNVFHKAIGKAPDIEDGDEILSYRSALIGTVGGIGVMAGWLWVMGTPLWVALVFVLVALLIFIGITRIVAEAGVAKLRAPMIAPDLIVQGLGSGLIGGTGVFNLSMAYMWAADIQVFVLGTCSNGLRLIQEMEPRNRRLLFWAIVLALFIGALGSFWMIFHMAYQHGGINLSYWFFQGLPQTAYKAAIRNLEPAGVYWPGIGFFCGGGTTMVLMMWARQRLPWWPLHPIGFPIGANHMMSSFWFNVFLAWLVKKSLLRFGGAYLYQRSQIFFLGLITGQILSRGIWAVVEYFVR